MNQLMDGWFSEVNEYWPGQALSLQLDGDVLYNKRSNYQNILVFKSIAYGNVLVLDNAIQITEKDECSYQEIIAQIPLYSHPNPKSVLVIGGGDGGVLREVCKHDSIEEIILCDIDEDVIEVSKRFLPSISSGYYDKRVTVRIGDGLSYLKQNKNRFDVIITDSCDNSSKAATPLFGEAYFEAAKGALKEDGLIISQAESIWLDLDSIQETYEWIKKHFESVKYLSTSVPTYPTGTIGFFLSSKGESVPTEPVRELSNEMYEKMNYYTEDMHKGAFAIPAFIKKKFPFL